jgi:hypothetical protein
MHFHKIGHAEDIRHICHSEKHFTAWHIGAMLSGPTSDEGLELDNHRHMV